MKIPLSAQTFGEREINAAIEVLRGGQVVMGKLCREFEAQFAEWIGAKHAVFVNSGSSANLLAIFSLANPQVPLNRGRKRLVAGSEVIVPAVSWATTVWPIVQAGCIPVFVDSDPETLQLRTDLIEAAITEKTRAICTVHVLGNANALKDLHEICEKHNLWLIEDTCESLGTTQNNKFVGTSSDFGTFSFFFSHHMTTIEGGMIVTDNEDLAELARCQRAHGWVRDLPNRKSWEEKNPQVDSRFLFVNSGFNLRPTEINAAFGIEQLDRLKDLNSRRNQVAEMWNRSFQDLHEKQEMRFVQPTAATQMAWFCYPVLLKDKKTRDELSLHLESQGIETRPIICGNFARQPGLQHFPHRLSGSLEGADRVMECGLYWGCHPMMTNEEIDFVARTVKRFFQ
jgi:CDP-6-deoxy-D-xylo-4-hexulose-3-dehydrase